VGGKAPARKGANPKAKPKPASADESKTDAPPKDTEIVGGSVDEPITSPGPTTGGEAPLFPGADPELRCQIARSGEKVLVIFDRKVWNWPLRKRQTKLACRLIDAQAGELRSEKVDDAKKLEDDLELNASIEYDMGRVIVRFPEPTNRWELCKRGAQLATGLIRARARPLPSDAAA